MLVELEFHDIFLNDISFTQSLLVRRLVRRLAAQYVLRRT